jgi:hypothetical protein
MKLFRSNAAPSQIRKKYLKYENFRRRKISARKFSARKFSARANGWIRQRKFSAHHIAILLILVDK